MQVFINHIGYVLMTLAVGVIIGWSTYPALHRVRSRVRERAAIDRNTARRAR